MDENQKPLENIETSQLNGFVGYSQPTGQTPAINEKPQPKHKKLYAFAKWMLILVLVSLIYLLSSPYFFLLELGIYMFTWVIVALLILALVGLFLFKISKADTRFIYRTEEEIKIESTKKWNATFVILGAVNLCTVIMPYGLLIFIAIVGAQAPFVGLLLAPALMVGFVVLLINIFLIIKYLKEKRPAKKVKIPAIIAIVLSVILLTPGLYVFVGVVQSLFFTNYDINRRLQELEQSAKEEDQKQSSKTSNYSVKTKDEAIDLMESCKVDFFTGYTDINLVKNSVIRSWNNLAEKSSTGIVMYSGPTQAQIYTSKAMTTELLDTARQSRKSCNDTKVLYISADNWYEVEYPKGQWMKVDRKD